MAKAPIPRNTATSKRVEWRSHEHQTALPPSRGYQLLQVSGYATSTLRYCAGLAAFCLVGLVCSIIYRGYLETRIYTPLNVEKVVTKTGHDVPERFWGSYRPGYYFGLKHRSPKSMSVGLMWLIPSHLKPGEGPKLRHQCQQGDNLEKYGWIQHDGVNFGVQEIFDGDFKLTTSFVKRLGGTNGGDWTARISVESIATSTTPSRDDPLRDNFLMFFYVANEPGESGSLESDTRDYILSGLHGTTPELGNFVIKFVGDGEIVHSSRLATKISSLNSISDTTLNSLKAWRDKDNVLFGFREDAKKLDRSNLIIYQAQVKAPFTLEVIFESSSFFSRPSVLTGDTYTAALDGFQKGFETQFEDTFHLSQKGFNKSSIAFAQAALSNLVGGIGYFSGLSKVQSILNYNPVPYWNANLYTAVPSRSFFPRGFLWDEGFHLLLLNKWNPQISLDIIAHWLDLVNSEGWIPREQILGDEAILRVPAEFVVQRNTVANPPTLFMAISDLLKRHGDWLISEHKDSLRRMWPRLNAWYNWLQSSQKGEQTSTFRWRGRNRTTILELNPKTLGSGLDDYPRSSHPSTMDYHLDLRCWMVVTAKLMRDLAQVLSFDGSKFEYTYHLLTDSNLFDSLHWSEELGSYADFGLHSQKVKLISKLITNSITTSANEKAQRPIPPSRVFVRDILEKPKPQFVNMFGYVSLFPLLLRILRADSPKLEIILNKLKEPSELWTPYGLRSLSTKAPLYGARNTEHDPPYWRNPIWININFLAVKALKEYGNEPGKIGTKARELYVKLREAVVNNIMKEYWRTGYIWEQYDDVTGEGKGCRPFTGWSALVVLIMAEDY